MVVEIGPPAFRGVCGNETTCGTERNTHWGGGGMGYKGRKGEMEEVLIEGMMMVDD